MQYVRAFFNHRGEVSVAIPLGAVPASAGGSLGLHHAQKPPEGCWLWSPTVAAGPAVLWSCWPCPCPSYALSLSLCSWYQGEAEKLWFLACVCTLCTGACSDAVLWEELFLRKWELAESLEVRGEGTASRPGGGGTGPAMRAGWGCLSTGRCGALARGHSPCGGCRSHRGVGGAEPWATRGLPRVSVVAWGHPGSASPAACLLGPGSSHGPSRLCSPGAAARGAHRPPGHGGAAASHARHQRNEVAAPAPGLARASPSDGPMAPVLAGRLPPSWRSLPVPFAGLALGPRVVEMGGQRGPWDCAMSLGLPPEG